MSDYKNSIGSRLERPGKLSKHVARAIVRNTRPFGKHRSAVLVDELNVQSFFGFLDGDPVRSFSKFRKCLEGLTQGRGHQGKIFVVAEAVAAFVGRRRNRRILRWNMRRVFEV